MSGGSASFTDTAIQVRLEPPRSLHGVEDADVIWDTITRRFPNAAPLLCEMETVIERAEDLLRQLKTPCAEESDTSSSFHTPDSRESNVTISSDMESFTEETNVPKHPPEIITNVGTQLVARERQEDPRSEQSVRCETEYPDREGYHSSPKFDEVVQHFETSSANKCEDSRGESGADVTDCSDKGIVVASSEERLMARIAEQNSLEGWTKVADNVLQEWRDNVGDDTTGNDSETRASANRNTADCLSAVNKGKTENTDDVKVAKTNLQDAKVGRNFVTTSRRRSPLTVLEEYAKRCQVPIKYENKPKPNLYVINGDLCGFRAMSCADTQDLAKNELAAKILWLVAERQMNGSKLSSSVCGLSDFSREEMLEITEFNKDKLKNASQKLYKICLEKGVVTPEYSIHNKITNQGNVYEAQCKALGLVGIGQGKRKDNAKIAAAENLFQKYTQKTEQQINT
ncbi:uncharacterized protein LOC109858101 isoform X2 [Pseudomyrmex gracilis]|uniref:uncharacterized protein LOC109858101 isoform X2 n=1 Tax=Pseudomyrmex gracilis TaxID=219809 RepID=UPI00099545D6|nr:uncharacterized protein LOC109858101 isoform X2 [Pseudomyrmex gracilis]